jgi:Protein of unknown function (DUF1572)
LIEQHYLDDCLFQLRKLKTQADRAMAQVDDSQFFALLDPDANSIALIVKHVAGNMRSRWTDFLTSDGEKPDRQRDTEFELDSTDTRDAIRGRWDAGWDLLFSTVTSLRPGDLGKTVVIRNEPHTVVQAINRQVSHYSAHVGQIVLLAKHLAGPRWQSLSIPKKRKGGL